MTTKCSWVGGRFTAQDAAALGVVASEVTHALRRSQAATFDQVPAPAGALTGAAVLMLAPDLTVRQTTRETGRLPVRALLRTEAVRVGQGRHPAR